MLMCAREKLDGKAKLDPGAAAALAQRIRDRNERLVDDVDRRLRRAFGG